MAAGVKRISTHVLDTAQGKPAADVQVKLEKQDAPGKWISLGSAQTDQDGRCAQLLTDGDELLAGIYRLTFDTKTYHAAQKIDGFYPAIEIIFQVRGDESHFHVPLLLSPYGYTTYRGS